MNDALLFGVILAATGLIAVLVRTVLRVPPRLIAGNLDQVHVPTPLSKNAAFEVLETVESFPVVRNDDKRGVVVLEATPRIIAERLLEGRRVRTFGYWIFLVVRSMPNGEGSDVAVGVQRKWLEFGKGSKLLQSALRDVTVRELWTKLPPPPRDGASPSDA